MPPGRKTKVVNLSWDHYKKINGDKGGDGNPLYIICNN